MVIDLNSFMTGSEFDAWLTDPHRPPLVMGILNVTPDSFSEQGRFFDAGTAIAHGQQMAAAGAALIDVGGESTRPGSEPVAAEEQIRRVIPVIRALRDGGIDSVLSIDTSRSAVAEAALDAGAHLVNDIFAGRDDPQMLPLAARRGVPVVLMHMQGRPATMQVNPVYQDVVAESLGFLRGRVAAALDAGVASSKLLIDPGIGFGKTMSHNLELIRRLKEFAEVGFPMVVGVSRKGFIGRITGESISSGRQFGTAAAVAWAVANGAGIVRVHDVEPMAQVVRMIEAIQTGRGADFPQSA